MVLELLRLWNKVILGRDKPPREWAMMTRRVLAGVLILGAIAIAPVAGQSNDIIDSILAEDTATVAQAAYIAFVGSGTIDEDASLADAFTYATDTGLIAADRDASAPVRFGEYAYFMMHAFGEPGGLMYRLIPGPRYAAREFVAKKWTRVSMAPNESISGELMLRITGNYMERREASI